MTASVPSSHLRGPLFLSVRGVEWWAARLGDLLGGWYDVEVRTVFILLGVVIVIVVAANWQAPQPKPTSPPSTPTERLKTPTKHVDTPTVRCVAALSLMYIKTGRWVVDGGALERWHWCQDNQSLFEGDATPPITKKSKKNP
jgi:hypothetical protein